MIAPTSFTSNLQVEFTGEFAVTPELYTLPGYAIATSSERHCIYLQKLSTS